jgi:hypothetical protein
MDLLRRLATILLVIGTALCVAVWASDFNPLAFGIFVNFNPVKLEFFPDGNPMYALGFGFFLLPCAYFMYPSARRDDDDD